MKKEREIITEDFVIEVEKKLLAEQNTRNFLSKKEFAAVNKERTKADKERKKADPSKNDKNKKQKKKIRPINNLNKRREKVLGRLGAHDKVVLLRERKRRRAAGAVPAPSGHLTAGLIRQSST